MLGVIVLPPTTMAEPQPVRSITPSAIVVTTTIPIWDSITSTIDTTIAKRVDLSISTPCLTAVWA